MALLRVVAGAYHRECWIGDRAPSAARTLSRRGATPCIARPHANGRLIGRGARHDRSPDPGPGLGDPRLIWSLSGWWPRSSRLPRCTTGRSATADRKVRVDAGTRPSGGSPAGSSELQPGAGRTWAPRAPRKPVTFSDPFPSPPALMPYPRPVNFLGFCAMLRAP
jgi:hypothetical protein